jgi:hypothetical protein
MRAKTGWLMLCAAAAWGLTVFASEKPPDSYVKNMKETNAAAQELRKNLDAKDYEGIAKNAAALKTLFATTQSFWEERKMEDAVGFAKNGANAAADLEAAAKARNDENVASIGKALLGTCKTCHDAHRERLPDGTSEIK